MSRYLVLAKVTGITDAGGSPMELRKGHVVEATAAQVTAWGASSFRALNNPALATVTTTYGNGSSTAGIPPSSPTHDTNGEAAGVSN